jgi:tetratricopeptide (TPR) repeat protein
LFVLAVLGAIYRSVLNLDLAYATHTDLMNQAQALAYPAGFMAMIAAELCADCVALGRWEEALTLARQASAHRNYTVLPAGHSLWPEALALVRGGDLELARRDAEQYRKALTALRRHRVSYLRTLGILAQAQNRPAEANEHWREAVALAEEIGLGDDLWQLYLLLEDKERATELVRLLVLGLGDPRLREMFRANLSEHYGIQLDSA